MDPSGRGVYQDEMRRIRDLSSVEIDQLFSGKAPAEDGDLFSVAGFVSSTRSAYLTRIDPQLEDSHLTALMKVVHLTDKGDLAVRPASKATGPGLQASELPMRRRRFMETLLAGFATKIAAAVIAFVMAATGGLAATGNLPAGMQSSLSDALAEYGIHIPDGDKTDVKRASEDAIEEAEDTVKDGEKVTDEIDGDDTGGDEGTNDPGSKANPNPKASFGQRVAADARDGGVDGQQISEEAHLRNEARRAAREEDPTDGSTEGDSEDTGSHAQTGLDRAKETAAGGHIPGSLPGGKPAGAGRP